MWRYSSTQAHSSPVSPSQHDRLRNIPHVKEHIRYYNERTKKASQIPRLVKSSANVSRSSQTTPSPRCPLTPDSLPAMDEEENNFSIHKMEPSPIPTASSIYTLSPDLEQHVDESAQVQPLFASRANATHTIARKFADSASSPTARKPLPIGSVYKPLADRAAKAGITGLGIETQQRQTHPWQGNTGTANLLTPIADVSVASVRSTESHSVSPMSSKGQRDSIFAKYEAAHPQLQHYNHHTSSRRWSGPTISDIDDRDYRSMVDGEQPSAFEKAQQSFPSSAAAVAAVAAPALADSAQPDHGDLSNSSTPVKPEASDGQNFGWSASYLASLNRTPQDLQIREQNKLPQWIRSAPDDDDRLVTPTRTSYDASIQDSPAGLYKQEQNQRLVSRFSWTTKDTPSPQETPAKDNYSPAAARYPQVNFTPATPILARGRPIAPSTRSPAPSSPALSPGMLESGPIRRKPAPVPAPSVTSAGSERSEAPSSNKELPLSPLQLDSIDIITSLEAQLADCAHRKRNLKKLIQAHSELQHTNPVIQDLARRREMKKKVEHFETELAEVTQLEYDLGLKLHRAWKRRDQEAPTAIWVRRICS